MPNVTFWTYKKIIAVWSKTAPAPQPNSRALRDGPGLRATAQCLTSLSELQENYSCLTQNGACATAKQQGPEGRTGPAGHSPQCLTSLSESTRKLAVWAVFQPPKASQTAPPPHQTAGPWGTDRACGPRPPVPNVTFWTYKKIIAVWSKTAPAPQPNSRALRDGPGLRATAQCLTSLSELTRKLQLSDPKRRLRHGQTARPWRTDRACGPQPPVPNVTFWIYKKTSCLSCLPAAKSFTNGASATPKQQGPEGRTGPAGHGPQCLTSLSELTRKL